MLNTKIFTRLFAGAVVAATICGGDAQILRATRLPGGGSIGLPAGWTLAGGPADMVSASGPQGRVDLGIYVLTYTPEEAAKEGQIRGHRPPTVGPYDDPGQAMIDLAVASKSVTPGSIHIIERVRDRNWNEPGEDLVFTISTTNEECLASVLNANIGQGQFMLHQSSVCAPKSQFARNLPVLLRIWCSWHVGDGVFQQRLRDTVMSLQTSSQIVNNVARERGVAGADQAQIFDKIIKGCADPYAHPESPWCEAPRDHR